MPLQRRLVALVFHAAALAAGARAQDSRPTAPYGSTLTFGSGLINIPTAWVSPGSGDLFASVSGRSVGQGSVLPKEQGSLWDLTVSLDAHFAQRFSLGASLYSTKNQQVGGFGQLLVYKQGELHAALPSIAIGFRNLGSSAYQDRYVTGDRRVLDALPDSLRVGKGKIDGSPSFYGVATREFRFEKNSASLSLGYGSGLFRNDGGLGAAYNKSGTLARGMFLGGRVVIPTGPTSQLALVAENDAWDWNAGALVTFGHVSAGLYVTELEEQKGVPNGAPIANFTKIALMLSYDANIPEIIRGSARRSEVAELDLEARRLRQEIAQRKRRADDLIASMTRAQQGADKAAAAQRARLQQLLEVEQAAMRKAAERLEKLPREKPPEGA